MKTNARKITFLMSIFFTLVFGFQVKAEMIYFSQDNPVNTANDMGLVFDSLEYSGGGTLQLGVTFTTGPERQEVETVYLRKGVGTWTDTGPLRMSCSNLSYPHDEYYNITVDCGSPVQLSGTWYCPLAKNDWEIFNVLDLSGPYYYDNGWQYPYVSGTPLTKTLVDNYYGSNFLENNNCYITDLVFYTVEYGNSYFRGELWTNSHTNNPTFPYVSAPPPPVDGVCGADNGETTNQEPPVSPHVLCDAGTAGEVFFYDNYWGWSCDGLYGGSPANCLAYNTLPIDATCGADNGGTFTLPDEPEDLCSSGYVLDVSFVETTTGWTWACMGYQGGENAYCDATKGSLTLPDLPEQEDCGSQSLPDKWLCEISNSLKSIFLPSASKITELQNTLNQVNARFPFNYLSRANSKLQALKNNTNSDTIEITIMGNTGEINIDAIEPLAEKLKIFTSGLFVLGFIFWGIAYIKHFFK
jgi:hypothetical protein